MKNGINHIFLYLAVAFFGVSLLFYLYIERGAIGASEEKYLQSVKVRVREEVTQSQQELLEAKAVLQKTPNPTFSNLLVASKYPYYVFKNRQLVFWSDHRFIPDYQTVGKITTPRLVEFEQGKYLISKATALKNGDTLDVFSAITIYRHYENQNNYLQSGYDPDLFSIEPQNVSTLVGKPYQNVFDDQRNFVFSVVPPKSDVFRNQSTPINTIILGLLTLLFLGIYVLQWMYFFIKSHHYSVGFVILAVYLVLVRALMLYYGIPFIFYENELFNSRHYASSDLAPSLGDLLLNVLFTVVLLLYLVNYYYRSRLYFWLTHQNQWIRSLASLACVWVSYAAFFIYYYELNSIYEKSMFTLDITLSIAFSPLKIACLVIFVGLSSAYFLSVHLLAGIFIRCCQPWWRAFMVFLLGSGLATVALLVLKIPMEYIFLVHSFYFLLLFFTRLPRILYSFRYITSIYFFTAALFCAVITTYVVYYQEDQKEIGYKQEFGTQLLADNDRNGEFFLDRANANISQDSLLQLTFLRDTIFARERIQSRVKSKLLSKYLDKYETEVLSFDEEGRSLENNASAPNYQYYVNKYQIPAYKTKYANIYFVNEFGGNFIKQYLAFAEVTKENTLLGYVILDLKQREELPQSVYPELLMDKNFIQAPETRQYSYALYSPDNKILYSNGSYNYERKMPIGILKNNALFREGLNLFDYRHIGVRGANGRSIVVSSLDYPFKNVFSNFSFLYLILVLFVIILIILYAVKYGFSKFNVNYSTKIQILLNAAFFLPLLLVVVITLSVISSNYVTNQENTYINNTKNIANNFIPYLTRSIQPLDSVAGSGQNSISEDKLTEELAKIARDADVDINLFQNNGLLRVATKPLMYEGKLLSKQINPYAYRHLLEDKENQILLSESLGDLQYRTAYVAVKSAKGQPLGVLSVPYFESKRELEEQMIDIIASVLSIFAAMFIVFIVVSYFASNSLINPLKLLTQKIRKTNLDKLTESLVWRSDDEIGLLIGEYNRMLLKLDESKQALSASEKQSAWREMAKQVAHEIKNPLTPMKLTLQQLQRTMPKDGTPKSQKIEKTFDTLLDQIDNLSDIATSFSDFAKMPPLKQELFDLTSVLSKAADLYADDPKITLDRQIENRETLVVGDRSLMGRIITNLIINGIQSVPETRRPTILLKLNAGEGNVNLEVRDNGMGIPESIRSKVFFPNFSTKLGGSGVGLAIAKRGIEHANGSIWLESEEGQGTTFFISLPLAQQNTEQN